MVVDIPMKRRSTINQGALVHHGATTKHTALGWYVIRKLVRRPRSAKGGLQ